MKIISINTGSSSLKFSLFDMNDESVIASGLFERIGIEGSCYKIKFNGQTIKQEVELTSHDVRLMVLVIDYYMDKKNIKSQLLLLMK